MKNLKDDRFLIPIAFGIIYFVWGSTYLANWYAIQDMPPFLMAGSRFVMAGLILYSISLMIGGASPTFTHWKNAAYTGILLLGIGTGGVVWSEQYINSGIAALIVAFEPLLIVILMWQMLGRKPSVRTIAGTFLGIAGMFFLIGQDQFTSDESTLLGIAVIFVSIFAWGYATIRIPAVQLPGSRLKVAGMQMLTGGTALLLFSLVTGELFTFSFEKVTARGWLSWFYLMIFGSIIAFSAFNYLLVKTTPDKVATSNYVNPVVALLLGWGLNNEVLSAQSLIAAILLLAGVILINSPKIVIKRKKNTPANQFTSPPADRPEQQETTPVLPVER